MSATNISLPTPSAISTIIAPEPDSIENAVIVLPFDRMCVPGRTQDFALNLEKTSLNGCATVQPP